MPELSQEEIKEIVNEISISELLEGWDSLSSEETLKIFLNMDPSRRLDLFNSLSNPEQEKLLEVLSVENVRMLLKEMEPDDLADFIQSVSPEVRKSVWQNLSDEAKRETLFLLRFDEDDAAGLMTPRYLAIRSTITVAQAINFIRKGTAEVETIYYIYVVDRLKRLMGVVSLRRLLSSPDDRVIEDIMQRETITVREDTDQEEVAKILQTYDLIALPVVDHYNRLLGIITIDDVLDVIQDEQTEDVYKMGAMGGSPERYLDSSIWKLVRKRIPWLIILLILGTVTTNVVHHYESLILGAAFLFIFMPVITQTGGNSGNQSTTLMVRGLATGEIHFRNIGKIIIKEILVGIMMGLCTGAVIMIRSFFLPPGVDITQAITIGVALAFVVLFSTLIGALAPLVFHRLGLDPTVMSAPLIATVIDVCGLTIYFETARLLLGL